MAAAIGASSALSAGLTHAATITWDGGGASDANWTTAFNWDTNTVPVSGDSLVFSGFTRLGTNDDLAPATQFNGITFASISGAFTLAGNSITLGGDVTDNTTLLTQTISLPLVLNATRNLSVVDQGSLSLSGVISGTGFGLNKTGLGTATLSGANTFTGPISITGGTLSVSSAGNLGSASATGSITLNGATLRSTGNFAIPSTRGILLGPSTGSGSGTFEVITGNSVSYSGVIANNGAGIGSLNKLKFGNLVLGGANTYSGATNVRNGGLTLNFADAAAPQNNIINPASNLVLGGATAGLGQQSNSTITVTGNASTADIQTFASTLVDIYGSVIQVNNGATGGTARLNLGVLSHNTGGSLVIPTGGTTGTVNASGTPLDHGILGGWAVAGVANTQRGITMGTDFATLDGNGNVVTYTNYVAGPITDGTTTTNWKTNPGIVASTDKNVKIVVPAANSNWRVDSELAGTTTDINTLNFDTAGNNGSVLTIGEGNTLRFGRYGAIYKSTTGNSQILIGGTGGGTFAAGPKANAGNITAGGAPNTAGEIVIGLNEAANNSGGITVVSNVVDNGSGAVTVIKNSVASAKFDGHNSYSGGTYINQGRFQLAGSEQLQDANALSIGNPDGLGTGPVFVAPGAYLFISGVNGNGQYTGPGAIAGAYFRGLNTGLPGSSAQNAPMYNNLTISGNGTNQEAGGSIRFGNRSILFGTITLAGDTRLFGGNAQAYPTLNPDGTTVYFDPGNELRGKITGNFNLDFGGRAVSGINIMISNTANDWGGNTTLLATNGNTRLRLGNNQVIPDGPGKGNLVMGENTGTNTGVLDMQGYNETINGLSTDGGTAVAQSFIENDGFTATVIPDPNNVGQKIYSYTNSTSTLTVGNFDQTASFGGIIRDFDTGASFTLPDPNGATTTVAVTASTALALSKVGLTKIGAGVQTLSGANTYSGPTTINGGTLSVVAPGSLNGTGTVIINAGGTLSGSGSVGNVTMNPGGHIAPGTSVGTVTLASLASNSGDLAIEFGASNNVGVADRVQVNGNTTFTGTITITPFGSPVAGTYTVLHSNGGITGGASYSLGAIPTLPDTRPASGSLDTSSANDIKVVITGGAKILNWTGSNGVVWDKGNTGTVNWFDTVGSINEKFFNGDVITFPDGPTNRNVTLNTTVSPGSVTFTNSTGNDYTISGGGAIIGNAGISTNGSGTVTIATNNSFVGNITTSGGTLVLSGSNVAPAVTNSGTLKIVDGGTVGAVTNNATLEINTVAGRSFSSAISGGGPVNKTGTGKLTLTGANTGSGSTNVIAGIITMDSFTNRLGTGITTVSSGAQLDLGGITGTNVAGGFGTRTFRITGAGPDGTGAITNTGNSQQQAFQEVDLDGDATVGGTARWDIRGGIAQLGLAGHTLTKVGTNQISVNGGTITDGNIVVNAGTFSIQTTTSATGSNGSITYNPGSTAEFFQTVSDNFSRPVVLNDNTTITNNNTQTAGAMSSPMTFNGQTTWNVGGTGGFTMNGFITGSGGFTKVGTGQLQLSNGTASASNWTGGTVVSAGTLLISLSGSITGNVNNNATLLVQQNNALGNVDGTGTTTLGDGNASVTSANHVSQSSLTLSPNAVLNINASGGVANGVSNVGSLTIGSLAKIDISDNKLITNNPVGTVSGGTYTDVTGLIQQGRNGGGWGGTGIVTSQSTAAAGSFTTIGVASASQIKGVAAGATAVWGGQTVTGSQTLVMYTYGGDANLDGKINVDDYGRIDSSIPLGIAGWYNGDFNYDGKINVDDYGIIDSNIGTQGSPFFAAGAASGGLAASGLRGVSAVPEPASISVLSLGAMALLGSRRRRRRLNGRRSSVNRNL